MSRGSPRRAIRIVRLEWSRQLTACNDQPTEPGPAELVIVQAPSTVGAPGWELIDTLVVRAVDPSGTPRAGVEVTWAVRQGGGSIAPTAAETDADGYAKAVWTLGGKSGVNQVRARTVEGSQADFESTGEAFRVDRLASHFDLGCGLISGAVWCWGRGFWATSAPPSDNPGYAALSTSPGLVDDSQVFADIAVGYQTVCALDSSHVVWCGTAGDPAMKRQAGLPPIARLTSNRGGPEAFGVRICGLALSDSTAWCWEVGATGVQLPSSPPFTTLRMSGSLVCGLSVDSTAACWGGLPLGAGFPGPSDTPVAVSGGHRFVDLAAGRSFACGRTASGVVWCWGSFSYPISDPDVLISIPIATGASLLGVEWESIQVNSLGSAMTQWQWGGTMVLEPRTVSGLEGLRVAEFGNNSSFSCLQLADGQVYCYDEMWRQSAYVLFSSYSPVQPVRQVPVVGGLP